MGMDMENRGDLVISGSGSASGGDYQDVKISGAGTVYGNLSCGQMKINGQSEVKGSMESKAVEVNGSLKIQGGVQTELIKVNGDVKIGGDLDFRDFKCVGNASVKGRVTGDLIDLEGWLKIQSDCEAESFIAKGAFQIEGLLNAGEIDLVLYGACSAKEIGGEKISVRKKGLKALLNPFLVRFTSELTADTIEGDEITLENTKAKVVRGKESHHRGRMRNRPGGV
ncbi:polymer-forming cytoskeletal protein [Paenibacillus sp. P26]|nr:polymer-forming cytoskeletal protein [Paenibacillus sp. P26]